MALVTMSKLTFVGLQQHKDTLYDVLISSQSVHLKPVADIEACTTVADSATVERLMVRADSINSAISYISSTVDNYNAKNKKVANFTKVVVPTTTMARPLVEMSYNELSGTSSSIDNIMSMVSHIEQLSSQVNNSRARISQIDSEIDRLDIYKGLLRPISSYKDTDNTRVVLGTVANNNLSDISGIIGEDSLAELTVLNTSNSETLVQLLVHTSQEHIINDAQGLGLTKCTIKLDILPRVRIDDLQAQRRGLIADIDYCHKQVADYAQHVPTLRTAYDYTLVQLAKQDADNIAPKTGSAFILEGYVPKDKVENIRSQLDSSGIEVAVYDEDIADDEYAPTMYRNNGFVRSFEGVTNMYTPPTYHEIDPNPVMSLFYFVIFGMMVADIGYGLVLALVGLFARIAIKQNTGIKSLMMLIGTCGVAAIGVGALYGSFFSSSLYSGVLPDPSLYPKVTMVIAVLFGFVHLMAGYLLQCASNIRAKKYTLAFGVSLMWALFFGFGLMAILELALDFMEYPAFGDIAIPAIVSTVGLYGCIASVVVAILCAGGGGKVGIVKRAMAGFGSAYGLLNLFGDVMSYIRIFGLMLSSAMMGVVINDLAAMVAGGSIFGSIMSVLLLVFAHMFNLVIGILGVYIHCGRLQYVEFFGKFYQGDGQMFQPFGSNIKYTLIKQ